MSISVDFAAGRADNRRKKSPRNKTLTVNEDEKAVLRSQMITGDQLARSSIEKSPVENWSLIENKVIFGDSIRLLKKTAPGIC